MKKILALLLVLILAFSCFACNQPTPPDNGNEGEGNGEGNGNDGENNGGDSVTVMTYAEYVAAPVETAVVIEAYVQAHQSWWDNKITVYLQDEDGAYFAYNMTCTEEQLASLTIGQKIRVSGYKAEWAGEIEIIDCSFEVLEGNWIATPVALTEKLASDNLIHYQNQLATFEGLTVKSISYKNDTPGDDIYLTFTFDGKDYDFCIEYYLTNTETEVYQTVATLNEGDIVDVTGFVYWYNGINTHITAIELVPSAE